MRNLLFIAIAVAVFSSCQKSGTAQSVELKTENDSVSYALGVNIGESLKKQGAGDLNFELMLAMAERAYAGDTTLQMNEQECMNYLNTYFQRKQMEAANATMEEGKQFLAENAKKEGVMTTPSGVQYKILKSGDVNAPSPVMGDKVLVNYTGTFINGEEFDSNKSKGAPATLTLGQVIQGFNEILQMMHEGDHWMVYVPSEQGYGSRTGGRIPANSVLVFDLELVQVVPAPAK
ncbi:MAG TPA: peptidylprolyl isomerase [Bacteroidetes bacterium]|nr:peptidylprolyl isomerase [Bacteroidota bacterium]HQU40080.1 FKBP-type peptidyl-prolyl cis-trans isomerase [Chitinophagales bacterium]